MTPLWGDPNHDWAGINDCVEIMCDMLGEHVIQAKEKFGGLRCYVSLSEEDIPMYRKAYETCVAKYPHLREYILAPADYPEYLIGIVPEDECDHPVHWVGPGYRTCGVCMKKEMT